MQRQWAHTHAREEQQDLPCPWKDSCRGQSLRQQKRREAVVWWKEGGGGQHERIRLARVKLNQHSLLVVVRAVGRAV